MLTGCILSRMSAEQQEVEIHCMTLIMGGAYIRLVQNIDIMKRTICWRGVDYKRCLHITIHNYAFCYARIRLDMSGAKVGQCKTECTFIDVSTCPLSKEVG